MQSSNPQSYRVVSNGSFATDDIRSSTADPDAPNGSIRRKGSFSFLRRSKSRDRSASAGSRPARKLSKKDRMRLREDEMMQEQIPPRPPRVPLVPRPPDLPTFGGEDTRPDSVAIMSNRAEGSFQRRLAQKSSHEVVGSNTYRGMPIPPVPPIPPIPGQTAGARAPNPDMFPQVESMANRGRYSYASSAISTINSPRKVRRRKDPTPFNVLVLGSKGSGKTSFINFLRDSLTLPPSKQRPLTTLEDDFDEAVSRNAFPSFVSQFVETEIHGERIGVTLWDSDGFQANVADLQLKEITNFIESKFENTYTEESKVARTPGFRDTHIHCTFLLLDPIRLDAHIAAQAKVNEINGVKAKANSFVKARPEPSPGGLDENLDLNILRTLKGKTTVVPIIAKADTITAAHMAHLKRAVWGSLKQHGLETLEGLSQEDEDDSGSETSREEESRPTQKESAEARTPSKPDLAPDTGEEDKFSMTSHLESSSDSDSGDFDATNFDLAKPGKPLANHSTKSSSAEPSPDRRIPNITTMEPPLLPMSIISPDLYEPEVIGRKFIWGFADPNNKEHCDFLRLKDAVFREWRGDLREASRELCYEGWRTSRLNKKARRNGTISLGLNEVRTQVWAGR